MKKYIAHAGIHLGSTLATQNSLRSIEYAAAAGFDFVELDVWITSDGVPVVLHNREINATYRKKDNYEMIAEIINACDKTYSELCEGYIGKADNEADRAIIPTLSEALTLCKKLGIIPMIHPKADDHASTACIMKVSDEAVGKMQYYIVSSNAACDYVLAQNPNHPCMVIVKDKNGIDKYSENTNVIIAIRRGADYAELVSYAHEKGHQVETTLNDDVHSDYIADVINYDYRSPGRFEKYEDVISEAFDDRILAAGEEFFFCGKEMCFGTIEASFRMRGKAMLTVCGREFTLDAEEMTDFRATVFVYCRKSSLSISAQSDVKIENLKIRTGKHEL